MGDTDAKVRLQLAFTLGEWKDAQAGEALGRLAIANYGEPFTFAAVMSSAVPHVKALTDAANPEPEERQIVQQQMKAGKGSGGMHGLSRARSNCRPYTDKNGKAGVMCPASTPSEAYYDRIAKLEDAVRNAEEELAQAEQAWRRGVD